MEKKCKCCHFFDAYPDMEKKGLCIYFNRMVCESTSACRDYTPVTDRTFAAGRIMMEALKRKYPNP